VPLHGKHLIAGEVVGTPGEVFQAMNPSSGTALEPGFSEGCEADVDQALEAARAAAPDYAALTNAARAAFLDDIADGIIALGDALLQRAMLETGLPEARLAGERARTVNQVKMFAALVREGSWVEASIDHAIPGREPLPKPDMRRMLVPIGPVVIFGASNFPLAFSVAGGDSASALAAGNPIVVKGHEAHPGTSELVAGVIAGAVQNAGLPGGVFSLIQGRSHEVGLALVRHSASQAVGFTGSLRGGRALFDVAHSRPEPIPVYAEMGSINPVFVLPGAMQERAAEFAAGLTTAVTASVGQFCTNPGLVVALDDPATGRFIDTATTSFGASEPATMLHAGIKKAFAAGVDALGAAANVSQVATADTAPDSGKNEAAAILFMTDSDTFRENEVLQREVFGPASVVVKCRSKMDLLDVARQLEGNLTATIHGSESDLAEYAELVDIVKTKVGRIVFNGFPTGLEVCPSTQHGGPYPACTIANSTSVGTAAITRFARPIAFQGFPDGALPPELQEANPRGIRRLVDGDWRE